MSDAGELPPRVYDVLPDGTLDQHSMRELPADDPYVLARDGSGRVVYARESLTIDQQPIEGHALRRPTIDVWIAYGLRKRWRVVSLGHTYGEWETLPEAESFIELLVAGNPDLARLV